MNKKKPQFTFKFDDGHTHKIEAYQSPRGIRHNDKRPNLVVIDCNTEFNQVDLCKFIRYLTDIVHAMEFEKK